MAQWWGALMPLQQVMFIIGCAMIVILIIQIVMMLIGSVDDPTFDLDTSIDIDGGGDPFNNDGITGIFGLKLLSVRSIVAFFAIGSWACFILLEVLPVWASVLLAVVAGLAAAVLMAFAIRWMEKLQSSGNITIENAVGKTGEVYLTIPASRQGNGKIQINIQERLSEITAITDAGRPLKTGEKIKVTGIVDDSTLLVEPL